VYTIKAYHGLRVDWDEDLSKSKKVEAPKPVSAAKPVPAPAAVPAATLTPARKHATSGVKDAAAAETSNFKADLNPLTVDKELERRKARAAKWGTEVKQPVVARPAPAPAASAKPAKPTKIVPAAPAADVGVDMFRNGISLTQYICRTPKGSKPDKPALEQARNQINPSLRRLWTRLKHGRERPVRRDSELTQEYVSSAFHCPPTLTMY
jgi:hypothetical protein